MYSKYKSHISPLSPVVIKCDQVEVNAPQHDTWGVITCEVCNDRFAIGPNRIHTSRMTGQDAVQQAETLLAQDHANNQPHRNSYELAD